MVEKRVKWVQPETKNIEFLISLALSLNHLITRLF
jgi:hypothetical protein